MSLTNKYTDNIFMDESSILDAHLWLLFRAFHYETPCIQVNLPSSYIPCENFEPNEEFHKFYLDSLPLVGCLQLPGMFLILILAQKT